MSSTLPSQSKSNSVQSFFNLPSVESFSYNSQDVDAVVGYFQKRGFDQTAAINTAGVLLRQAAQDNLPVFELIDTLKGLNDVQLSSLVAQILNINRNKCSVIGYRVTNRQNLFDQRNILV